MIFLVGNVNLLFDFISVFLHMYINNCVHIMFKIQYMTIILSNLLLGAVHMMQGFIYEKMLYGKL